MVMGQQTKAMCEKGRQLIRKDRPLDEWKRQEGTRLNCHVVPCHARVTTRQIMHGRGNIAMIKRDRRKASLSSHRVARYISLSM